MPDFFSDITTLALEKSLDGLGARHKVISNNIANVETPGFKRSDVVFEDRLKEALKSGSETSIRKRIKEIEGEIQSDTLSQERPDGNNVSIDREMADLTKNTLRYETLIQLANLKGAMIRAAINEGRR